MRLSRAAPNIGECTCLSVLPVAQVHVHAARQARVEAAHRAHDVDAAEVVLAVLLEDRLALHRVLVRARACRRSRVGLPFHGVGGYGW